MQAIEGVKIFELRNPVVPFLNYLASQEKAWSRSPSPACTIAATQQTRRSALLFPIDIRHISLAKLSATRLNP